MKSKPPIPHRLDNPPYPVYDKSMKKLVITALLAAFSAALLSAQLRITCFDVGQGNGAYIQSSSGKNAVIDAGPDDAVGQNIWSFIRDTMQIRHLDYTFASHYHDDHIDGLDQILDSASVYPDSFRVGSYDRGYSYDNGAYDEYVASAGAKRHAVALGQVFDLDSGVTIQCVGLNGKTLSGDSIATSTDENNNSLALLIGYGAFKMIFATDLAGYNSSPYKDVETILAPDIGPVSVMIVNHHGSATSSNPAWVSTLKPAASIISMGHNNTYHHPTQETIDRLCANSGTYIYQTEDSPANSGIIPAGRGRVTNSNIHILVDETWFTVDGDYYSLTPLGTESDPETISRALEMEKPYPNPSTGRFMLGYQLPRAAHINISIYNVTGQLVKRLMDGTQSPGRHSIQWDGRDEAGAKAPTGIYLLRYRGADLSRTLKLVIMR